MPAPIDHLREVTQLLVLTSDETLDLIDVHAPGVVALTVLGKFAYEAQFPGQVGVNPAEALVVANPQPADCGTGPARRQADDDRGTLVGQSIVDH